MINIIVFTDHANIWSKKIKTSQVDNRFLNASNNGLNWVLRMFKDQKNYAHITLNGPKSRGPIADLVIKTGL